MEILVGEARLRLLRGDITKIPVDAMGNAANAELAGGGGVDGAIHRAGGPSLMKELDRLRGRDGCPTGAAVITGAGALPAKWVLHAVGPVWRGGGFGEPDLLASAYEASLRLAAEKGARSVSFPSISTGTYGYPVEKAAPVALRAVADFLRKPGHPVRDAAFVLFDGPTFAAYELALAPPGEAVDNSPPEPYTQG